MHTMHAFYTGKGDLLKKIMRPIVGGRPHRSRLNTPHRRINDFTIEGARGMDQEFYKMELKSPVGLGDKVPRR